MNITQILTQLVIPLLPVLGFFIHTIIENKVKGKFLFRRNLIYLGVYSVVSIVLNTLLIPDYIWWAGLIQIALAVVFFLLIVLIIGNKLSGASITAWTALVAMIPYPYFLVAISTIIVVVIAALIRINNRAEITMIANQAMINKLDYSYLPDHDEAMKEQGGKKVFIPLLMIYGLCAGFIVQLIWL